MEAICTSLVLVGITPNQYLKGHLYNVRNLTVLLMLCLYIFVLQMYLIQGAANLKDYADCIYLMITVTATALNFGHINWKMTGIFQLIDKLENIVGFSKFQIKWK